MDRMLAPALTLHEPARRPDESSDSLLRDIRDILKKTEPESSNTATFQVFNASLPAAAGSLEFQSNSPIKNITITATNRQIFVWAGLRSISLGAVNAGQQMMAKLPFAVDSVHIEFPAGAATDQVGIYVSTEPLTVSVLGGVPVGSSAVIASTVPTDGAITVNAASTPILPANANRLSALIVNTGTQTVFLFTGGAATTAKFPLAVGASVTYRNQLALTGIVAAGTGTVYVIEEAR